MLSIIIPTLNEEKYLPGLLRSLKRQSFKDFEVIVSDGGSEDKTRSIVQENGFKLVEGRKEKRHPSIQRNDGAKIAQGEILLFLDADTILPDDYFLEKTVESFQERKLGVAGFYMDFKSNKFFYKFYYCFYNSIAFLAQYFFPLAVGAGIIVKKVWHEKVKGFDEKIFIGEDHDYCKKIAKLDKFRIIKTTKIFFSIRRFEKEGPWKLLGKMIYSAFYVFIFGSIKKRIVKYDFGEYVD